MGCAPWNELENNVCFIAQKDYKISDRKAAHRGRDFHIWAVLGCFGLFWAVRVVGKNFIHFTKNEGSVFIFSLAK